MVEYCNLESGRKIEFTTLEDERLILIDPSQKGFFNNVMNIIKKLEQDYWYSILGTNNLTSFVKNFKAIQGTKINPFWKPIMDPSVEGERIVFSKGNKPAVGYSFYWWMNKALELPSIEDRNWTIGTEEQYYVFIIWLINRLIDNGWKPFDAFKACTLDSKELGHYSNSGKDSLEKTGSRFVCGVYDLANTNKILNHENKNYCLASGDYNYQSNTAPLSTIFLASGNSLDWSLKLSVGWLVLS